MTETAPGQTPIGGPARIDHYQIIRLLGRGGMGEVYLARDTQLGRKVALKLVNPGRVGSLMSAERFKFEARATARFNHPNIVTIHAAGEHEGQLYVALEYIAGMDLKRRLEQGEISIREAMRIGLAMALALAEAHGHNLLHRDLKPGNVLIAADGRVRVADFGLAKVLRAAEDRDPGAADRDPPGEADPALADGSDRSSCGAIGSPPYMSPEQWRQEAVTAATDVWSMGVVLYEMVAGQRPYPETRSSKIAMQVTGPHPVPALGRYCEVPGPLAEMINRCLDKEPTRRPSAGQAAAALQEMLASGPARPSEERCPFPGLMPFSEDQAPYFFGRDPEISTLVERLRREPVIPIVGVSGAGKSSFVQAGVIPRLRERRPWVVLRLRPGSDPFSALASKLVATTHSAVRTIGTDSTLDVRPRGRGRRGGVPRDDVSTAEIEQLSGRLSATSSALGLALHKLAELSRSRVLLFVDQLEELFVLVDDPGTRDRFLEAICTAADDEDDPVRVLFTLRDDFLARLADHPRSRDALRHVMVLGSPAAAALKDTLCDPLRATGYEFEDARLPAEMIDEVRGELASLPLLQFCIRAMWERRDRAARRLLRATHAELGGVSGALAAHADEVLHGLSSDQQRQVRNLLLRLVTGAGLRRVLPRQRLLQGLPGRAAEVLDRLTSARLITIRQGAGDSDSQLELAHESLVKNWPRLSRWIDESRQELVRLAELEQGAELWQRRGSRPEEVWRGEALREAGELVERHAGRLGPVAAAFVQAGAHRETRRRRLGRLAFGGAAAVLIGVAVASLIVAWALSTKERRARASQRQAEAQRSVALVEGAQSALKRGEVLEARAKLRVSLEAGDSLEGRYLWWRLKHDARLWKKPLPASVHDVSVSPDGQTVAAAGEDRAVYLIDARSRAIRALRGHPDQVRSVAYAPGGKRLAAGMRSGEVWLWDLTRGAHVALDRHAGSVRRLTFSDDGALLASASWDGTIWLRSLRPGGRSRRLSGHVDRVYGLGFSPDGALLASGSYDRRVVIWSTASGEQVRALTGHTDRVFSVVFSPDGRRLASASQDRTVRLWSLKTGAVDRVLRGHGDGVRVVRFSPDGKLLASAGADKSIRIWNAGTGAWRGVLTGHTAGVTGLAFDRRAPNVLVSSSFDKTVRRWTLAADSAPLRGSGHTDRVNGVSFSPDGKHLASASSDRTVRIWRVSSGRQQQVLRGHDDGVIQATFDPGGGRLATAGWDRTIRIWDLATGTVQRVLVGHTGEIHQLLFTGDGRRVISASWDRTIRIWHADSGAQLGALRGHTAGVRAISLGPDGRLLASGGGDRTIRLWELTTGLETARLTGHESTVTSVDLGPRGARLVSGSYDRTVRLWRVGQGTHKIVGRHPARIYRVAFHPDGERVGSVGARGAAFLWDLKSKTPVALRGHRLTVNDVVFGAAGLAASAGDDGSVRLWRAAQGQQVWRAAVIAASPPALRTHQGWIWRPARPALARRLPETARAAAVARGGDLCVQTVDSRIQIWGGETRHLDEPLPGLTRVLATDQGCVTLARGKVQLFTRQGWEKDLYSGVRAMAAGGRRDGLLVATDRQVLTMDLLGRWTARYPVGAGVTALARLGRDHLAAGHEDGRITHVGPGGQGKKRFSDPPASQVTRLLSVPTRVDGGAPGSNHLLVAGYASGMVAFWSVSGGARLERTVLHGPVAHLASVDRKLYMATELGDHRKLDLAPLHLDTCAFVRTVWAAVPVVWRDGRAAAAGPPAGHRCLQAAGVQ